MTAGLPRTLPLRVEPWPGESMQSWVEQLASAYGMRIDQMGERLGLPPMPPYQWTHRLSPEEAASAAYVAGLDSDTVTGMTVAGWSTAWTRGTDHAGIHPDNPSKHCPRCLEENGGRWLLAWRLPLHTVCRRHQIELATRCGRCSGPVRGETRDAGVPCARRCRLRCRSGKGGDRPIPHGSIQDAGAAFLDELAGTAAGTLIETATGTGLTAPQAHTEALLLAGRMRSVLHEHDLHDTKCTGEWQPPRACGKPLTRSDDATGMQAWALAAAVLLAPDRGSAIDALLWMAARERRLDRFPRTAYEHHRMPEAVGPALAPLVAAAVDATERSCPDNYCEVETRLRRLQKWIPSASPRSRQAVDYDNLDQALWDDALAGWAAALREGRAA